jgi:hypothetical protein
MIRRLRWPRAVTLALLAVLTQSACDGSDPSRSSPPVETVTVTPNPASVAAGETVQLTATLRDVDGNQLRGRLVQWSSSDETVATVNGEGLVTGVAEGSASITATSEGKSGSTALAVTPAPEQPPTGTGALVGPGGVAPSAVANKFNRDEAEWLPLELVAPLPPGGRADRYHAEVTSGVLLAGGYTGSGTAASDQGILLDAATDAATPVTMTEARVHHTMTPLPGFRTLVTGGFDGDVVRSSAEVFTQATAEFVATGAMGIARGRHAAAPLPDGRVLVTGGLVPTDPAPATIEVASTEIYDPASGTFSPGDDMNTTRFNHSAVALDDGRVLVLGGNGRFTAEVYDPATGEFSFVGDMATVHGHGHQAVKLPDGRVLVTGGDAGSGEPTALAEIFDPATGEFTQVGDMTTARMLHFAVLLEDTGEVLVGGGQDESGAVLQSAELFDPATGEFTATTDMPQPGAEQAAVFVQR